MVNAAQAIGNGMVAFDPEHPDVYGIAHPKELLKALAEEHEVLRGLVNQHIVSSVQFDRPTLLQLFRLAAKYEANPDRFASSTPLAGKILISAFYEPSTRTRLSFESAWHRLGGDIMSITDRATTGIAKGESLADIGEMFNNYGDCVVLRDTRIDSVVNMMRSLRIPIINAGNGTDEHPTQALADLYTILKWRPDLVEPEGEKIRVGIIGVPSRMRTVRSLLTLLSRFASRIEEVVILHDGSAEELYSPGQLEELQQDGLVVRDSRSLDAELPAWDVVYINAKAWVKDDFETHGKTLVLNDASPLKPGSIVMHPLARGEELDPSLDATPHNWYFAQARGAVFVRMALLTCLTRRTERVMDVV